MKKLYNGKVRRVHPSPPTAAALPAAILALAAVLTAEEQEVLAYLLSGGVGEGGRWKEQRRRQPHAPELGCGCFGCYKSFWARWDASPNRHVIHRIIDAVEESLELRERGRSGGRRRRRSHRGGQKDCGLVANERAALVVEESVGVEGRGFLELDGGHVADDDSDDDTDEDEEHDKEEMNSGGGGGNNTNSNAGGKSSVRRFVSFIGEKVWGAWN